MISLNVKELTQSYDHLRYIFSSIPSKRWGGPDPKKQQQQKNKPDKTPQQIKQQTRNAFLLPLKTQLIAGWWCCML